MQTANRVRHTLRKQTRKAVSGRHYLRYSAGMGQRRKTLGEHVRAEREALGYMSMPAFATAIDISPRSVAKVENGAEDVGPRVLRAVARGIRLPPNSLVEYLRTGDPSALERTETPEPTAARPAEDAPDESVSYDLYDRVVRDGTEKAMLESFPNLPLDVRWGGIIRRRLKHGINYETINQELPLRHSSEA